MRFAAILFLVMAGAASAQDWGPTVKGLRVAAQIEGDQVVVTFQNTHAEREMFLPLGQTVGIGRADRVHLDLVQPDGSRQALQYTGGSGVAPGRLLPYIVPMMPGSIYTVRTPLRYWRSGGELKRIEAELAGGAALQASIFAPESLQWQNVGCYGLQMFWSGRAISKVFRSRAKPGGTPPPSGGNRRN